MVSVTCKASTLSLKTARSFVVSESYSKRSFFGVYLSHVHFKEVKSVKGKIVGDRNFEVYEDGTIFRFKANGKKDTAPIHILKNNGNRYPTTSAQYKGEQKHYYPHRLVAEAFIPNPENKEYVEIIDGNPYNLAADNLRWINKKEQVVKAMATRKRNQKICEDCGKQFDYNRKSCPQCLREKRRVGDIESRRLAKQEKINKELAAVNLEDLRAEFRFAVEARLKGNTLQEIGESLGVSRERARQMIACAKEGGGKYKIPKRIQVCDEKITKLQNTIDKLVEEKNQIEQEYLSKINELEKLHL